MADDLRRLVIEIGASYVGARGLGRMDRDFDKILGKQRSLAAAAKMQADAQIKEATRSAGAIAKINDRIALSNRRMEDLTVRQAWAASRGRIQAYQTVTAAIGRENEKIIAMQKTLEREQIASEQRIAAATVQANRARNVARVGAVAGGVGALGSGLIGAGAVGLGAGILLGRAGVNWQTFVSQNVANAPFGANARETRRISERYQREAMAVARRTGANPEDVFQTMRYGQEFDIVRRNNLLNPYLRASLALGLPTGGTANIGPSMQAIAGVTTAFPQYARNPRAIANMLLATTQRSAGGLNVQQLAEGIPRVLSMAGHIGGPSALPDALAAAAALSQTNVGLPEVSTALINFLKVLQSGTVRKGGMTNQTLEALRTQRGINLFPDFSTQGLAQKGLGGVLSDIAGAHLSQRTLYSLFPNMRGTLAALGLTGNQLENFRSVQPAIANAPRTNPIAQNMQMYLGLSSTKMQELNQQLHTLAITTGTQLLPAFNELMKDAIIPGAKEVANFTKENRGLIVELIKISPWLIGAGVGLKAVGAGLKIISGAGEAVTILKGVGVALGLIEGKAAATTALEGVSGAMGKVAPAADAAIGVEGVAGAGTGILGLVGALGLLAIPVGAIIAAAAIVNDPKDAAKQTRYSKTYKVNGQAGHYEYVGRNATWVPGPSPNPPGGTSAIGRAPAGWHPSSPTFFGLPAVPASPWNSTQAYQQPVDWQDASVYMGQGTAGGYTFNNPDNLGPVAFHWDVPAALGNPYYLPGGKGTHYRVVGIANHPTGDGDPGWVVTFETDQGAVFTVGNLAQIRKGLTMGSVLHGGVPGGYVGRVGAGEHGPHVHIAGNQMALNTFKFLATGGSQRRNLHGAGGRHGGVGGLSLPGVERPYGSLFTGAGGKYHIDPAILAGIGMSESSGMLGSGVHSKEGFGVMGMPMMRTKYTAGRTLIPNQASPQTYAAAGWLRTQDINWLKKHPQFMDQFAPTLRHMGITDIHGNEAMLVIGLAMYNAGTNPANIGAFGIPYAQAVLKNATAYNQGNVPATYYRPPSARAGGGTSPGGGVNVNLGQGAALTPLQKWTQRTQGDVNVINQMLGRWGWPANTPMARIQNEGRREMIAPWYKAATYAFAQQQIASINQLPISEARKAAMRKDVWHQYYSGALSKELFGKVPPGATRPTTPGGWATWYGNRASQLQTRIGAIAADFPGADLTHPSARQRALLGPLLTGPHGLYRTTLEQTLSMDKVIYAGQPKLRELADRAAWGAYHRAMRHPFTYFPATGANQRPTTPMGWSQWYGAQASTRQGEISQLAALFPNADLSHPNARQRAMLLPLLLGTAGHPGYYKDLLRETLSMDRAIYAGHPHLRALADRAAWGAYHRELRHPFAYFQGTSATGSQITPVQVVGSSKQLGVAEEHLKVAKQQLAEQKKQTHQEQQQIRHLERVINKLVHWINHHGGHVNVANDYSGVAVTGTAGHP